MGVVGLGSALKLQASNGILWGASGLQLACLDQGRRGPQDLGHQSRAGSRTSDFGAFSLLLWGFAEKLCCAC